MPTAPYATLRVARNGGAPSTGAITCSYGDSIQLSMDPAGQSGVTAQRWEIYEYPSGYTVPAGWTEDPSTHVYYNTAVSPTAFTLPASSTWGKWLLRLTINNGDPGVSALPATQFVDEATALEIVSAIGLHDLAYLEETQFSSLRSWVDDHKENLRTIDNGMAANLAIKAPVRLATTSNLAATRSSNVLTANANGAIGAIDGVTPIANERILVKDQTTAADNGVYYVSDVGSAGTPWRLTRATDFDTSAEVLSGYSVIVTEGTFNRTTAWLLATANPITLNTTALRFVPVVGDMADVRRFGAVGDDSTNDTAAIQAAIDSLGNGPGTVIIPDSAAGGIYRVQSQLLISSAKSHIRILGLGGKLKKVGANFNVLRIDGSFCKVLNLEIDGADQAQGSLILITGSDNEVAGCYLHDNGDNTDVSSYANASHGIALDGQATTCRRNFVHDCRIQANHDIGVAQNKSLENRIVHNTIASNGLEGVTIDNESHRNIVALNTMRDNCLLGGVAYIGIDFSDLNQIIGNQMHRFSGAVSDGIKTQNNLGSSSYNLIVANTIVDMQGWGVRLFAGTLGTADRNVVNGNVIRGSVLGSVRLDAGCDFNQVIVNSLNGAAPSDAGTSNVLFNDGVLSGATMSADPTVALGIATKQYVDNVAAGLDVKPSTKAATTGNITLSGTQTIDGVSVGVGDRVLVKNQSTTHQNGIYVCASGAWTRATDADSWDEHRGAYAFVEQGTVNGDTAWVCTVDAGGTLGVTAITWSQFAGVGTMVGGTGITVTGNSIALATMTQATVKGRAAGAGTGDPTDLTQTQLTALITALALSQLATQAANSVVVNATGSSAVPTALSLGANTFLGRSVSGTLAAKSMVEAFFAFAALALGAANTLPKVNSGGTAIEYGLLANANIDASAAIALSKLATQAALSVVANATNGSAVPTAVAAGSDNEVFRRSGTALGFGLLTGANLAAAAAVALSQLATQAEATIVGRLPGAGTGVPSAQSVYDFTLVASSVNEAVSSAAASANIDIAIPASTTEHFLIQVEAEASGDVDAWQVATTRARRSSTANATVSGATVKDGSGSLSISATASTTNLRVSVTNNLGANCRMNIHVYRQNTRASVEFS